MASADLSELVIQILKHKDKLTDLAAIALILLSAFSLGRTYIPTHSGTSLFDEYVYIDYLAKSTNQFGVKVGEETGWFAREVISCDSVWPGSNTWGDGCGNSKHSHDSTFPWAGKSTAYLYSPAYFTITRIVSQPLVVAGMPLVDAARWVDMLWIALGIIICFKVAHRLSSSRNLALGLTLLLLSTPATFWSGTYVTPDSTAYLVGGTAGVLSIRALNNRSMPWVLIPFGILATLIKPIYILAPLAILLVVIFNRVREDGLIKFLGDLKTRNLDHVKFAMLGVISAGLTTTLWGVYLKKTQLGPEPIQGDLTPFTPATLIQDSLAYFGQSARYGLAQGATYASTGGIADILLCIGFTGLFFQLTRNRFDRGFSSALFLTLIAGPTITILWQIAHLFPGNTIPLGPRYGIILMPSWLFAAALCLARLPFFSKAILPLGFSCFSAVLLFPASELHGPSNLGNNLVMFLPIVLATGMYLFSASHNGSTEN